MAVGNDEPLHRSNVHGPQKRKHRALGGIAGTSVVSYIDNPYRAIAQAKHGRVALTHVQKCHPRSRRNPPGERKQGR